MGRAARILAAITGLVLVAAGMNQVAGTRAGAEEEAADPAVVERGRAVYGSQCARCHGELGRGVAGVAPSLLGIGAAAVDFAIRTGRMPIDDPRERMRRGPQQMSDADRDAVVAYLVGLEPGGPPIPTVDPGRGDLGHGRELFTQNCAACHGPTGMGIAVGQRDIAPALDVATALETALAIRAGPGRMPRFGDDVYDQQDLDSVVAWTLDLRERESPGGLRIGRGGPVSEGAVAWILGIGGLLWVMYLLGERPMGDGRGD